MSSIEIVRPPRVLPEWRNYCVYSGKFLPDAALSKEDVIPKSLGGNQFTVIFASRTLNSTFGTK